MDEKENGLRPKLIGALLGLALALVLIFAGVLTAFIIAFFLLGGWLLGKYVAGEIDLEDLYERYLRDRTR